MSAKRKYTPANPLSLRSMADHSELRSALQLLYRRLERLHAAYDGGQGDDYSLRVSIRETENQMGRKVEALKRLDPSFDAAGFLAHLAR